MVFIIFFLILVKHTILKPILNAICDNGFGVIDYVILQHGLCHLPFNFGELVLKPTNAIHDHGLGAFNYVLATIIGHSLLNYAT